MPCSIFRVYSTYTAQLSSKRKGMEAEGKTWNYRDILAQFITMHWAADIFLEIVMQPFLGFDDIVPDSSSPATV